VAKFADGTIATAPAFLMNEGEGGSPVEGLKSSGEPVPTPKSQSELVDVHAA